MYRFALILLVLLALPAVAGARPSQWSIVESPRELRSDDPADRTRALDQMASLGADIVRFNLFWRDVAPAATSPDVPAVDERDPSAYDWTKYDRVLAEARARGLDVQFTVTGPGPVWSTRDRRDGVTRPVPARFERFVTAVGRHFRSVQRWSIYNEPNHPLFLQPQYVRGKPRSGELYRDLYLAARRGLKRSGNGRDLVLMGETAPFETKGLVSPLEFLRDALRGRRIDVDGWAHHPYSGANSPRYASRNRDNVTIASLGRLERALDKAARRGQIRRRVPIWITEYGVQSVPDPRGASQRLQNRYRTVAERMAFRNPRVRSFAQYLLRDDLPTPDRGPERFGDFESGLRFSGGRAKLSFNGYRLPLTADRRGRRVRFWGLVRPAAGRTRATLQVRRGGRWRTLRRVRTDRHSAFDLRVKQKRGRTYRLRWRSFAGASVRAR